MTSTSPPSRAAASLAALAVATVGITAVGSASATASTDSAALHRAAPVKTTVSIRLQQPGGKERLGGVVKSRRAVCKQGRPVKLHFRQPGTKKFVVVRTDKTNRAGVWVVPAPGAQIPTGAYFATVAKKGSTCKPARSTTIRVR